MRRSSVFVTFALGTLTMLMPACGSSDDAAADGAGDGQVGLRGAYAPATPGGTSAISMLVVESDTRYRLRANGCAEPSCEEHGAFTFDKERHTLSLVVDDTARAYSLPVEILASRPVTPTGARPSSITPKFAPADTTDNSGSGTALVNGGVQLVEVSVTLIATLLSIDGTTFRGGDETAVQDIPECDAMFGMGGSGEGSKFETKFIQLTNFRVDPRGLNGGFDPPRSPALCTTYDAWFAQWEGSCDSACNMPGGFSDTARKTLREIGSYCALPTRFQRQYPTREIDSLASIRANVVSRGGEVIRGQCRCMFELQYKAM